jgi:hypothetical protein
LQPMRWQMIKIDMNCGRIFNFNSFLSVLVGEKCPGQKLNSALLCLLSHLPE